jgi:hypothetical protein
MRVRIGRLRQAGDVDILDAPIVFTDAVTIVSRP